MMYIKKNVKVKIGYQCATIYDFNKRETYLISLANADLLLAGEIDKVNELLNNSLVSLNIVTSSVENSEPFPTKFEYILFDDYRKYANCDMVYFEVTNKCNFNCIHCYADMNKSGNKFLTASQMKVYIDNLDIDSKMNIRLTGGEPFLNPEITDILKLVSTSVVPYQHHSIVTNGTGKFEDIMLSLELGFEVQISLYGMCSETFEKVARVSKNYYDKMRNTLYKLSKTPYVSQIVCLFSINSLTYNEMIDFVNTIQSMGFRVILNRPSCVGRANKNWEKIKLDLSRHMQFSRYNYSITNGYNRYCYHACKLSWAYVDIDGNVKPCAFIRNTFIFGNLKISHLKEMRNSAKFKLFKDLNADSFDKCRSCEFEYCCTGGCCGETLEHTGKITNYYTCCVIKPFEKQYTEIDKYTIKKVRKYAGGTFDFFEI